MEAIRIVLAPATQMDLPIYQLDVKSAFLNDDLRYEVYIQQPDGYIVEGEEVKVYHLKKGLYSLKQTPHAWNTKIDDYFQKVGFHQSPSEASLYIKKGACDFLIVCIYVDDLIYMGTNPIMVKEFKEDMMNKFEMTDLRLMKFFLGIQVRQYKEKILFLKKNILENY